MRFFILCLLMISISGCMLPPRNAPAFDESLLGVADDQKAVLVIFRQKVVPYAYKVGVTVNGNEFANLTNYSFTWTYLDPGDQLITTKWPPLVFTYDAKIQMKNIEAGKYYYLELIDRRISPYSGAREYYFYNLIPGVAVSELDRCCKYIPNKL